MNTGGLRHTSSIRTLRLAALMAMLFAVLEPARAELVMGTFRGFVARGELVPQTGPYQPPPSIFGDAVTGSFQIDLVGPLVPDGPPDPGGAYASYFAGDESLGYTVSIPGQNFTVTQPLGVAQGCDIFVDVANHAHAQSISFTDGAGCGFTGFSLQLTSGPGQLFTGVDATTFRPAALNLAQSSLYYGTKGGPAFFWVDLTQVAFTAPVALVTTAAPEVPTEAFLLAGLALAAWCLNQRRAQALKVLKVRPGGRSVPLAAAAPRTPARR